MGASAMSREDERFFVEGLRSGGSQATLWFRNSVSSGPTFIAGLTEAGFGIFLWGIQLKGTHGRDRLWS